MERFIFVAGHLNQCYLGRYPGLRIRAILSRLVQLRVLSLLLSSRLYPASLRGTGRVLDCDSPFGQRIGWHFTRMLSEETGRKQEVLFKKAPEVHLVIC
jgi:hypothetical protein